LAVKLNNLGKSSISAGKWQFISVFTQAILQLYVLYIIARHISPESFGVISLANMAIMFTTVMTHGYLKPALVQRDEFNEELARTGFTLSVIQSLIFMAALWQVAPYVSILFDTPQLTEILKVLSITFFTNGLSLVSEALLERQLNFKAITIANLLAYIVYATIAITLAELGYGIWALIWAAVSQSIIRSCSLFYHKRHSIIPAFDISEVRKLLHFGGGIVLSWLFNYVSINSDKFIIGKWLGAESLGFYSMAINIMEMPRKFIAGILDNVLYPALSLIKKDHKRVKSAVLESLEIVTLFMLPLSTFMIMLMPDTISLLLGNNWIITIIPIQILLSQIPLRAFVRITASVVTVLGMPYSIAVINSIYMALMIIGVWIGHYWGIIGVAVAVTAVVVVNFFMSLALLKRKTDIKWIEIIFAIKPGFTICGIVFCMIAVLEWLLTILSTSIFIGLTAKIIGMSVMLIGIIMFYPAMMGNCWNRRFKHIN